MHKEGLGEIEAYFDRLWPINRSIAGPGVRKTHAILSELVPLTSIEVPSGTVCFDWTVPEEWIVHEAYVIDPGGRRILDVAENNLHLVSHSIPFQGRLSREDLDKHLHSLPDKPSAIPYLISPYAPYWGFCLSHEQRCELPPGYYEVTVNTELIQGSMTISEAVLEGDESEEVLISSNTCHPALANNELCGPIMAAFLYRRLASLPRRRLTYRFVFLPETIGSIAYLCLRGEHLKSHMIAGYIVTCVGDPAPFVYKRSRNGRTLADRAAEHVLTRSRESRPFAIRDFHPLGSDERQYCSPGFDLPVGSIMRSMYGTYEEYHTSLDNRDFIKFEAIQESIDVYFDVCQILEQNVTYRNTIMFGEPQLGKRGLYPGLGGRTHLPGEIEAMMWVLSLSDEHHDLLAMSQRSGTDMELLNRAATRLLEAGVLERVKS